MQGMAQPFLTKLQTMGMGRRWMTDGWRVWGFWISGGYIQLTINN